MARLMFGMTPLAANRRYRLLFGASASANLADGVAALAFPWLATLISRDPLAVALVAAATRLPWFLFSIPAGVLVDRHDRRRSMVRADLARMVVILGVIALVLSLPSLPFEGDPRVPIATLSCLALLLGAAEVVRDNAAQTLLPSIVAKEDLERANGQMWSAEQIMGSFVGPPLAGFLLALAVPAPFVAILIALGAAAFLVRRMTPRPRAGSPETASPRMAKERPGQPTRRMAAEILEGWAWMRARPTILRLAVALGVINALMTMAVTILVLFSREILGLDAWGHGVLLTAGAAGGVFGGIVGPMIARRLGGRKSLLLALMLLPFPPLAIGLTASALVVAGALFLEMVAALLWNVVTVSYRQRVIPDALLGRVNALYRFFGWGMMPIGALAGGAIVTLAEPETGRALALRLPYFAAAMGAASMLIYGLARLRL